MATLRSGDVTMNQALILVQPKIGYVRAWSKEDKPEFDGLAYLRVTVNSDKLPGISEMVINTNQWEVYDANDIEILKKIADASVKQDWYR